MGHPRLQHQLHQHRAAAVVPVPLRACLLPGRQPAVGDGDLRHLPHPSGARVRLLGLGDAAVGRRLRVREPRARTGARHDEQLEHDHVVVLLRRRAERIPRPVRPRPALPHHGHLHRQRDAHLDRQLVHDEARDLRPRHLPHRPADRHLLDRHQDLLQAAEHPDPPRGRQHRGDGGRVHRQGAGGHDPRVQRAHARRVRQGRPVGLRGGVRQGERLHRPCADLAVLDAHGDDLDLPEPEFHELVRLHRQ